MLWSKVLSVLAVVAGTTFAVPVEHPTSGHGRLFPRGVDYCAQAYNASLETDTGWFPASLALKCLQSLPYDQSIAESIIDSFIKMFAFYSVESYAKNSPNPKVQLNIDVPGQLASIKAGIQAGKYSFFEYQYALDTLVTSLNDGMDFWDRNVDDRSYWVYGFLHWWVFYSVSCSDGVALARWSTRSSSLRMSI